MASPDITPGAPEALTRRHSLTVRKNSVVEALGSPIVMDSERLILEREKIEGRVALITGATSGLGRATAMLFSEMGAKVVVVGRDRDRGAATQDAIRGSGGEAVFFQGDMKDPGDAKRVVEQGAESFGRIDIGVLNAGIINDASFLDMTPEQWYDVAHGNGDMTFFPAQALARQMISQEDNNRRPDLVFVSSVSSVGNPGQVNYSYSKAGIEAVARGIARSGDMKGVSVSTLIPGGIMTEMISKMGEKEQRVFNIMMKSSMPSGRAFQPEEMATGIAWLTQLNESGHVLTMA